MILNEPDEEKSGWKQSFQNNDEDKTILCRPMKREELQEEK